MERISAQDLHKRMTSENRPVLINALSEDAFRAKRIPGSINITENNLECAKKWVTTMFGTLKKVSQDGAEKAIA
jgi:hypothetical protein